MTSQMKDYWNRKISGQCVVKRCPKRQGETLRCERHRKIKNLDQQRYRK